MFEKSIKTSYLKNYRDLRTEVWRQNSSRGLKISSFKNFFKINLSRNLWKQNRNTLFLVKKRIWLFIYGGQNSKLTSEFKLEN